MKTKGEYDVQGNFVRVFVEDKSKAGRITTANPELAPREILNAILQLRARVVR